MKLQLNEKSLVIGYTNIDGLSGNVIKLEQYHLIINEDTVGEIRELTGLIPENLN